MNKIWMILVALSIFAFGVGYMELISSTFVTILLITTFFKGQLVIDYFMDLKNVEYKYRFIPIVWLFFVLLLISIAYYSPVSA